jgi:seryl-tRNA synthetase
VSGAAGEDYAAELAPAGLGWHANGQSVLSGPLLRLANSCDAAFTGLAAIWDAEPEEHPPIIDLAALQQIDYLESFPHLATFPVCLDPDETNLKEFTSREPVDSGGAVRFSQTAPVRELLTPAACYHVYLHHQGTHLDGPRYVTTRNTCFRREAYYRPLRRQWSFRMREIICLGTRGEVRAFLAHGRAAVSVLLRELDLPVTWEVATDPFFQPARNGKYLAQRLSPTKHEAQFADGLAIASVNLHEDHFGAAFGITSTAGPAVSGCVAFGIERWLFAITRQHGPDPRNWPDIAAAARAATGVPAPGSGARASAASGEGRAS